MSDYGVKISLEGKDISSTSPEDYLIFSKYQIPKTYIVGTSSLSFSNEADTHNNKTVTTVNHNLGYKPYVSWYWNKNNSEYGGDFWIESQGAPHLVFESIYYVVTTTSFAIYYTYNNGGYGDGLTGISGYNFGFKYYIFIDKADI